MRAIDIRYNQDIVGGKLLERYKEELENGRYGNSKEEIKEFLSNRGCPERTGNCFREDCDYFGSNCEECWTQKPYEYREWVNDGDEYDD